MVQRKVPDQCGIQGEPVKGDRRMANFKPASSQHQDGRNRGADLKKKMKKSSRPIKLSDLESLTSSPVRKSIAHPGKPPPLNASAIQQKQPPPLIRTGDGSPNYMKSTSCFDARKEVSQVSSRNTQSSSDSQNTRRRRSSENSVDGSVSGRKPTKCLSKSSSFKLVRTLTKTPSFKLTRGYLKKSSRVVLCADMNAQRATCSSTLKDSKFPAYLMLSPGGTESEGTSAMKVCPYTYCSLNGHRHAPLPPLKCFLSSRRRLLKSQKSLKSGALSPRKVKPYGCLLKEFDAGMVVLEEKMASEDLGNSESSPLINDSSSDFFIEIYARRKEDSAESGGKEGMANEDSSGFTSVNGDAEAAADNEGSKQSEENIADESLDSEVDLGEEITEVIFFQGNDYGDDAGSTDTEMDEWEEQQFLSMEADALDEVEDKSNSNIGGLSEKTHCHDGELFGSGDVKDCKGLFFTEELFYLGDSELNRHQDWEVEESSQVSESLSYDQLSYMEDAFDDMDATQRTIEKAEIEHVGVVVGALPSTEELIVDSELAEAHCVTQAKEEASINEQEIQDLQVVSTGISTLTGSGICLDITDKDCVETNEGYCRIQEEVLQVDQQLSKRDLVLQEEIFNADFDDQIEKEKQVDDATSSLVANQISESCFAIIQADNNNGEEVADDENSGREHADECLAAETQDSLSDGQCQDITLIENRNFVAERDETESSTGLEMPDIEELSDLKTDETCLNKSSVAQVDIVERENTGDLSVKAKRSCRATIDSSQELPHSSRKWHGNTKCRRLGDESEDLRNFNPREPNYLPLVPDPEAEKVDLKHQMMDDRKNAEEWMLDYALQQTVTKLAPARKKKVALLVEAFESVMPTSKCETHVRNTSGAFTQPKPIQACF